MTLPDRPRCADCRHFVPSHVYEGKGVCTHLMSGPRPNRVDVVRDLYVLQGFWCSDFEVRMARHLELRENR